VDATTLLRQIETLTAELAETRRLVDAGAPALFF
jgi:hypothetical protein